ncbi:aminotransferase class V-fold PLP-dependent enzyme [Rathayibacter sp. YIM 133350]|uniref:aminotransferase class V-fold PLP-dependent enzyme n=1 Tax=Rathayibacter sp. YIM 133350 TaxID=3131992 RepID=UPI00307D8389
MSALEDYAAGFLEEPGYLNYGRVGPLSGAVVAEAQGWHEMLAKARFGSLDALEQQEERLHEAVAVATGFPVDQVVTQPNTSMGITHAMFGVTGEVLLSGGEFPTLPISAVRAAEALHVVRPVWLETELGRVTPGQVKQQLTDATAAVAVTLVDSRTGYVTDLDGIRQVIGDRLLIVDAIQGFGIVDAPYEVADVVVSGGQKWCRAGWGTGFMALSARALDGLTPVISGYTGTEEPEAWDEVPPPATGARAFRVTNPDRIAQARFAAALEEMNAVGVAVLEDAVRTNVSRIIELADEFAIPVASSRDERERAGLIVLEPPADQLTLLTASLFNHGITATHRLGTVRLSVHAALSDDTVEMLRGAFVSYGTAAVY